ncbi:MAG: hypothetical protein QOD63_2844, partial [Actinomycetota bacterium]|nr:hypothetical protein [Actinomycetota bacterium]
PFTVRRVGQIMTSPVLTIPSTATVTDAREMFLSGGHGAYPIVDATGRLAGIVTRGDVLGDDILGDGGPGDGVGSETPVLDRASRDVVSVGPDAPATDAMNLMIDEQIEHVPVVDDDCLVGICTRTDLLKVRHQEREHERRQDGLAVLALRAFPRRDGSAAD